MRGMGSRMQKPVSLNNGDAPMAADFTDETAAKKDFVPADVFLNGDALVDAAGNEYPLVADRGIATYLAKQKNAVVKAVLEQAMEAREAGEDTVLTIRVVVRGKKPELAAAEDVDMSSFAIKR